MDAETWPKLLVRNYKQYGDQKVAIRYKKYGYWREYTWKDYYQRVKYISLGLVELGLRRGDKVVIGGDNEPPAYFSMLAALAAGGIGTGFYSDAIASEIEYIVGHSESKFAIVEDQEQVDKLLSIKAKLPKLERIIYWDPKGLASYDDSALMSLNDLEKLGRTLDNVRPDYFSDTVEQGKSDDLALILYTSGTRALPKGAMLTHAAGIASATRAVLTVPLRSDYNLIALSSLAWITSYMLEFGAQLVNGMIINFTEEPETLLQDLREIGCDFAVLAPRLWESLISQIQVKINDADLLRRLCYRLFLPVGYKLSESQGNLNLFWKSLASLSFWVLFRPLRDKLGLLKVKACGTGGAPISPDGLKFLNAIGLNIRQVYGLTELDPLTWHQDGDFKLGTIGTPVLDTELRISDDGEIVGRGTQSFLGYYKNTQTTQRILTDGWVHTGDAGAIGIDGHIVYYDRMEHLLELSDGTRFPPQYIEGKLKFSPYIKDAMTIGREFVGAIVQLDFEVVGKWCQTNHLAYTTLIDLSQKHQVQELITREIAKVNHTLPDPAKVRRFLLFYKEFDADEAELTRSKKLRREFMEEKYGHLIDALFSSSEEISMESSVLYQDGRVGKVTVLVKIRNLEA
jgi:long-chain acyl-CoA synthetase